MILWEEYIEESIALNESYLKYTQFCIVYKQYVEKHQLTMHIEHKLNKRCKTSYIL
ncbi:hypothetical protein [Thomasclavelia sp.]|uniref:hypothetical protein n=1 Tax=Thomasclavelia sp. TaxID=3025757 RepID=UPI0025E70713|nr:hypothetical protein [Thomasclavelia sp.]